MNIGLGFVCALILVVLPSSEAVEDVGKIMRMLANESEPESNSLNLPDGASSIRGNITDNFSCEDRSYGYYADIDNDCQIFHVCVPLESKSKRKSRTLKYSFICPEKTRFDQQTLVCAEESYVDMMDCQESEQHYDVNDGFGGKEPEEDMSETEMSNDNMTNDKAMENSDNNRRKKPQMAVVGMKNPNSQKKKNDRRKSEE